MKRIIAFLLTLALLLAGIYFFAPDVTKEAMKLFYPRGYTELVESKAKEFNLDPYLVYAVIKAESKFNERAISSAGAKGLMQLTNETFDWMNLQFPLGEGAPDIWEPERNIHAGCALLRLLLDYYANREVALCAYNAGMGNVNRWISEGQYSHDGSTLHTIPFPETREYVKKVEKYYQVYRKLYSNDEK